MNARENSQLELFSQLKKEEGERVSFSRSFFNYMRGYEKTIIIFIGFIITGVISYSLGVERGKTFSYQKLNTRIDLAEKLKPIKLDQPTVTQYKYNKVSEIKISQTTPKQESLPVEKVVPSDNFTIQVATYQDKAHADKEAATLRKKGLLPLVLSKGHFAVLYVGNFSNKETAKQILTELRKVYRDCFIRRL